MAESGMASMSEVGLLGSQVDRDFFGASETTIDDQDICSFLEEAQQTQHSKTDLLSTSLHDAGILKSEDEAWTLDDDTDALLNSILTGNEDETLLGFGGSGLPQGSEVDDDQHGFNRQLLSPAGSSSSGNSSAKSFDFIDIFGNGSPEDSPLQGVNPRTNSPDSDAGPEKQQDDADSDEGNREEPVIVKGEGGGGGCGYPPKAVAKSRKRAGVKAASSRVASADVVRVNAAPNASGKRTISVIRPSPISGGSGSLVHQQVSVVRPVTLASAGQPLDTATTTILLPVVHSKNPLHQPTLVRMKAPPAVSSKRRRMSASSSDSGTDDCSTGRVYFSSADLKNSKGNKYPRLHLSEEEKRLCEKEGIVLPSHYPLKKEEERNLKRIRRKIRNKLSAQDSRKRKKEYVDSMEAKAKRCAAENAELVKRLTALETQNKTLVGQLRRLHQMIVNRGGISSSNAMAQAAMGNKGQASTALMVLLLSTALFLIPGMKEQFESKPQLDIFQAVKGPPMPGQSRSLLHFMPQNIKEEYPPNNAGGPAAANANGQGESSVAAVADGTESGKNYNLITAYGDHDYVVTSDLAVDKRSKFNQRGRKRASADPQPPQQPTKKSYIVADVPPLGYGDNKIAAGKKFGDFGASRDVAEAAASVVVKKEAAVPMEEEEEGDERRLNVNVTGGTFGEMRTVVLHVPKDIK